MIDIIFALPVLAAAIGLVVWGILEIIKGN